MSIWTRLTNIARRDQLNREIDEELQSHIAEAIAQGRDPREVRASFGSPLRHREESRDVAWSPGSILYAPMRSSACVSSTKEE